MQDCPVYLINLDGSDDRLAAATAALQAQGVAFDRIPAFDGRGRDVTRLPDYDGRATRQLMGRDLTGGEVGCYISHVRAAERLLETEALFGLVLEDDMIPKGPVVDLVQALMRGTTTDWHVAHLAAQGLKHTTPLHRFDVAGQQYHLHRAHYFPMRTTALLWTRAGAAHFVKTATPINCPVDIFLRHWLQTSDQGVAVAPAPFATSDAPSDIAGAGPKRGQQTRSLLYPVRRMTRMLKEKRRAKELERCARKGGTS